MPGGVANQEMSHMLDQFQSASPWHVSHNASVNAGHLVLVVGGACSQAGRASWHRAGNC